jgi:hypothetical protein
MDGSEIDGPRSCRHRRLDRCVQPLMRSAWLRSTTAGGALRHHRDQASSQQNRASRPTSTPFALRTVPSMVLFDTLPRVVRLINDRELECATR